MTVEPLPTAQDAADRGANAEEASPPRTRRRIEDQIVALKRREAELRRELAMADHPALAEGIRRIEGKAFAVSRVEERMAQGLSKAEQRRLDTLEKKLESAREKRAVIDAQIAELEAEAHSLGEERSAAFERERHEALKELIVVLGEHEPELRKAELRAAALVPELEGWLPELEALATELAADAKR